MLPETVLEFKDPNIYSGQNRVHGRKKRKSTKNQYVSRPLGSKIIYTCTSKTFYGNFHTYNSVVRDCTVAERLEIRRVYAELEARKKNSEQSVAVRHRSGIPFYCQ